MIRLFLAALLFAAVGHAFAQGVKISDLPSATALTGDEFGAFVQGGITSKATVDQINTFIGNNLESAVIASDGFDFPDGWSNNLKLTATDFPAFWLHGTTPDNGFLFGVDTGRLLFTKETSGTLTYLLDLSATALFPDSNDGLGLGYSGHSFSDLFLASGATIDFDAGDVIVTHSSNALTLSGGDLFVPNEAYDASGWNGDLSVPTKDAIRDEIESLATGGGDVSKVGTPVDNQVGVWTGDGTLEGDAAFTFDTSTDALSVGTSGKFTVGTIELAHASANTLTASGGHMTIEGATVWDSGNDGSGSGLDADTLDGTSSAGFQTADAELSAIAGLTSAANKCIEFTGSGTASAVDCTASGLSFMALAAGTSGGVPYFSAANTVSTSAALTANQLVIGGGAGAAPAALGSLGTTSTVLHGNAAGAPTFAAVTLGTDTSGNYVKDVADGTGIDGTASGVGATYTPTLDLTEISSMTWGAGAFTSETFSGAGAIDMTWTYSTSNTAILTQADAGAAGPIFDIFADSASPANSDIIAQQLYTGRDSAANKQTYAQISTTITDVTSTSEDATLKLGVVTAGTVADEVVLDGASFSPVANDGNALGTTSLGWSDLMLATGGVINWANGEVTITETDANTLTVAGATSVTIGNNALTVGTLELANGTANTLSASGGVLSIEGVAVVNTTRSLTGGTGIAAIGDLSSDRTITLDLTELSTATFGAGSFTTLTFDAGATDPVLTAASNALSLTSAAELKIGSTTSVAQDDYTSTAVTPGVQHSGTTLASGTIGAVTFANSATTPAQLELGHAAGASVGTFTAVSSGDDLAVIVATGADGTNNEPAASILFEVDAATGANDMPGRITFNTTADGAATPTARLTLDSSGVLFPATNDGVPLGKSGNAFSDLWLASGGLIEWDGGTSNTMTCTSGSCTIEGNTMYRAGGTDVSLADGGTGASLTDPNLDEFFMWDDSAGASKLAALADINTEASPAAGDYVLIMGAEGDVRKANWSTLPGAGGGCCWTGAAPDTTLTSSSAGATGPTVTLDHNSASPAANDVISSIISIGNDDGAADQTYSTIKTAIVDPTAASEDSKMTFDVYSAGAAITALTLGGGASSGLAVENDGSAFFYDFYTTGSGYGVALTVTNDDADSGYVDQYKNSASPAAADQLGRFSFSGNDSGANNTTYASFSGFIVDPTNGSEDGSLTVRAMVAGTDADRMKVSDGVIIGTTTVFPGAGNLRLTNIELGADTDTTIARSGAGEATLEGDAIKHAGKQMAWIPAGAMRNSALTPASCGDTYDSGSNDVTITVCAFDTGATEENAEFGWQPPKSWNEGTVTAQFVWTNTAGLTTETVQWKIACTSFSDDDALNTAYPADVTVSDTWTAQNDLTVTAETSAITVQNATENDYVNCRVGRDTSADNLTGDALLIGVKLYWTDNASTMSE